MSAGERSYSYDANGNMIGEALGDLEVAYAYNASNRVVDVNTEVEGLVGRHWWRGSSWSLESGVRYEYDALGRRVSRTEYETTSWGGHWQRSWDKETNSEYLYDGQSMRELAEFRDTEYENDLAAPWTPWQWGGSRPRWGHRWGHRGRRSWWNRRPERYQPVSEYVYGNNDRVISRNRFNPDFQHPRWESATYYHQDLLGSTTLMTNQRGHTVERYTYDAFGVQTEGSFERVNEIGYTGQRYDPTTSMYDYGFRDYAPELARFTTVDPVRDGNNWYAYVNNDPVNFVDPLGLIADEPGDGKPADPYIPRNPYEDARQMEARAPEYSEPTGVNWKQVGVSTIDLLGGGLSTVVVSSNPGTAALGLETISVAAYGLAGIVAGFNGQEIPSSTDFLLEKWSFGFANTEFDQ